jgi:hypothetical protein
MKQTFMLSACMAMFIASCTSNPKPVAGEAKLDKSNLIKSITMDTKSYTATIVVDKDPETAFNAIKNFRAWWSEEIEGETDKLNTEFLYHYKDVHICKLKLMAIVPGKKLVYEVLDNQFNFIEDKTEWIGTKLIFDVSAEGDKTKVKFTHEGLVPQYECYKVCNDAWSNYINNSLYKLITTGKGEPNPKNADGFNAKLADKWKIKH